MPINEQSTEARDLTMAEAVTQEISLYRGLVERMRGFVDPKGMMDSEIAAMLKIPNALAAARRNGLTKSMEKNQDKWKIISVGKRQNPVSKKMVNVWGLVPRALKAEQGGLF